MIEIMIEFTGRPMDERDNLAHEIVGRHGGDVHSSGTFLSSGHRDLEARIPEKNLIACLREFAQHAAFSVRRTSND